MPSVQPTPEANAPDGVMSIAPDIGFAVSEEPLTLSRLFESDEVVLTSSLREVYPVRTIDGRQTPRGDAAERLRAAYHAAVLDRSS